MYWFPEIPLPGRIGFLAAAYIWDASSSLHWLFMSFCVTNSSIKFSLFEVLRVVSVSFLDPDMLHMVIGTYSVQ